jgi:hypothetical protein
MLFLDLAAIIHIKKYPMSKNKELIINIGLINITNKILNSNKEGLNNLIQVHIELYLLNLIHLIK